MRFKLFLLFVSCGWMAACGDLSQQRVNQEKIQEGMKDQEIKRVTESEVLELAFTKGREILNGIRESGYDLYDVENIHPDSLTKWSNFGTVQLHIVGRERGINDLERQILEAYQYSHENRLPMDENVQKLNGDTLLYTYPYYDENMELVGMWSIHLSKRELIRNM